MTSTMEADSSETDREREKPKTDGNSSGTDREREKPKPIQTQSSILSTLSQRHEKLTWFFNDMRVYIVFDIIQSFFWTVMSAFYWPMMTSIELQFQLSSQKMGFLMSCLEIGRIPLLPFLPYFGGRLHIPRLLGAMAIIRVGALVLLFLPHFLFGQKIITVLKSTMQENTADDEVVHAGNYTYTTAVCHPPNGTLDIATLTEGLMDDSQIAYGMFISSYTLFGMSSVAGPTLGMIYFDNNFDKAKLPLLLGITGAIAPLGPFMGSMLAVWLSRVYVDLSEPPITYVDPRWISAWWLGLIIVAVPIAIIGPLICLFPRRMRKKGTININISCLTRRFGGHGKSANETKDGNEDEKKVKTQFSKEEKKMKADIAKEEAIAKTEALKKSAAEAFTMKNYPKALLRILKNPLFILIVFNGIMQDFAWSGWTTFSMKYYEQLFRIPAWKVTTINTVARLLVGPLGSIVGGIVITRLRPTYHRLCLMILFTICLYMGIAVGRMFITCGDSQYAGFDYSRPSELMGECNAGCECGLEVYNPVCDAGLTHFSPCHAGCELSNVTKMDGIVQPELVNYYECNCTESGFARPGRCEGECDLVYLYVSLHSIGMFVWSITGSVAILILIRAVDFHDKAFAIGIYAFFGALLGSLPSAPAIGLIIDSTCRLFQLIEGTDAKCWIHDTDLLRFRMYGWTLGFMGVQSCTFVAIYYISKKKNIKLFNEDEPVTADVTEELAEVSDFTKEENGDLSARKVNFDKRELTDLDNRGFEVDYDNTKVSRL